MKDKKVGYREVATILILVISAFVLFTAVASADGLPCACGDICVNETGWWRNGGDFNASNTPIQHAVDNATVGETSCVKDGTYKENIDINKRLTIQSESGSANCIVNSSNFNDHVFEVTADYVNISGFTVQNATGTYKAGIYLDNVDHCTISENTALSNPCGIWLNSSSNNTLTGNTANSNILWGIYLYSSSGNNITNNDCAYNGFSAGSYDGIGLESSDDNAILNNNCSSNAWAGIYLGDYSSNNNVTNNTCSGNHEGIQVWYASNNVLTNNKVSDNDYGIYLEEDSNNNTLTNNTASYNNMKGIYSYSSDYNNVTDNTVTSNNEDGIFLLFSEHCTVINNIVTGHTPPGFSFDILVLNGSKQEYQGELSFSNYETARLPIKHAAGPLTLRLSQHGHDAAYLDYVTVTMGDTLYQPTAAVDLETGTDVLRKILVPEYDVCYAWNRTIELTWEEVPADTTLIMRAMEEDLGEEHGSPLYYPLLREGQTLTYTICDDGCIHVDGILEEPAEPDFSVFWKPESPHPDGYTYGWLHADDQYVYAAVEITADNTPDQ